MRFRVSDQEYTEIRAAAQRAGVAYGTFIDHTVQAATRQHKFGHQPTAELCEELRGVARQLNRIGVNLNQLARIANATGQVPGELPAALSYLENVLRRVDASSVEIGRLLVDRQSHPRPGRRKAAVLPLRPWSPQRAH